MIPVPRPASDWIFADPGHAVPAADRDSATYITVYLVFIDYASKSRAI